MRIVVPTKVKNNEFRVAITPIDVRKLIEKDREVYTQTGVGVGSSIPDEELVAQGAKIASNVAGTWEVGEMAIKMKEPIPSEYQYLRKDPTLFTHLHLAADRPQADALFKADTTAIAYGTVRLPSGVLPLPHPTSKAAGPLTSQVGAHTLMKAQGGHGVLMGCIGSVPSAKVIVLGGDIADQNAVNIAMSLGAGVMVFDTDLDKLRSTFWRFHNQVYGAVSPVLIVRECVLQTNLVVDTVLIPGVKALRLVTNDIIAEMKPGSVLVDVAIDRSGCFEDSHPTTHDGPTSPVHNPQFYYVTSTPGAVPNTSTWAFTNATLPYAIQLTDRGTAQALKDNPALARDLDTVKGDLTFAGVPEASNLPLMPLTEALDRIG